MENAYIFNYNFQSNTFEWLNFSYINSIHISQYIQMCIYQNTLLCFSIFCAILSSALQTHYIFNYLFIIYKYHQTFFIYNRLLIKLLLFSFLEILNKIILYHVYICPHNTCLYIHYAKSTIYHSNAYTHTYINISERRLFYNWTIRE